MVSFNSATSNFRRGGLTTRSGSSTIDLLNGEAPPTTTNQKKGWWSRAMDWVGNHSEGLGKTINGITSLGATIGDAVITAKGGKPFLAKSVNDVKKQVGTFVDKDESSGFGKFVKGLTLTPTATKEDNL